jgi:bifunctional UDP-N-acetylglucosamine pyrophosphorylase/glucosamine-1-phosphate N-acetyltransferase
MTTRAAIILAADRGTRMKSAVPKVLHRVCGKPMVALVAEAAAGADVDRTVVVVPPESEAIRSTLGSSVSYVEQTDALDVGRALLRAKDNLQRADNIVVLGGNVPLISGETLAEMAEIHETSGAAVTLLTGAARPPDGLQRVVRDSSGRVTHTVEDGGADAGDDGMSEVDAGIYWFRSEWLWRNLDAVGHAPSCDLLRAATEQGETVADLAAESPAEAIGVNTRVQLAEAEEAMRRALRERWMLAGVTMREPSSVYVDVDVRIGQDTVIHPNTHLRGATVVGPDCEIGPDSAVRETTTGSGCRIVSSVVTGATLENDVEVGPFSHIRPGSHLESGVRIGSFGEVSRSRLGRGSRSAHFSYIGDTDMGANVNIGAGTVTCNFDGVEKHRTQIGEGAFIGSGSMLVAPVTIGARARTGAGAVVTRDVPPDSLAVGVPARVRGGEDE